MLADLRFRIRALFRRRAVEFELDDELRFHFERNVEKWMRSGVEEAEARRLARLELGGLEQVKEECRDARGVALLEVLLQDFRYAWRVLWKSPGFSACVVLSLALGIGANAAIFSLLDAVMWRMLPVERPEELMLLTHGQGTAFEGGFTYQQFRSMCEQNQGMTGFAAWSSTPLNVRVDGHQEPTVAGQIVSGGYFRALGVHAAAGRTIGPDDDRVPNGHPVAMISYSYWKRRFGLNSAVIGRTLEISGAPFVVVGVTPVEFFGMEVGSAPDLFVPMMMQPTVMPSSENLLEHPGQYLTWVQVAGRLKPGIGPAAAAAQLQAAFQAEIPRGGKFQSLANEHLLLAPAATGLSELRRQFSQPLVLLMGLVGIVLLIACANTANLLLARAAARQAEFAMRAALGAPHWRLMSQLLVESMVLSIAGGALGLVFAGWSVRLLVVYLSSGRTPIQLDLQPNPSVLAFTMGISFAAAFVFGLAPAWRAGRFATEPQRSRDLGWLRGGGGLRPGKVFAATQVALSLVLLIGAGLFARSLRNANSQDAGVERDRVLIVRVEPRGSNQRNQPGALQRLDGAYRNLVRRVEALPGVRSVSLAQFTPTSPRGATSSFLLPSGEERRAFLPMVYPGFFATMGISLLDGRDFDIRDLQPNAPLVAVVNETLARQAFPDGSAVGKQLETGGERREVIGVVKDSHYLSPRGETPAVVYQTFLQTRTGRGQMALYVRLRGEARAVLPDIREAVQAVDPQVPVFDIHTLHQEMDAVLIRERLMATLCGLFSLLALVLAMVGLYGLFTFSVVRRTREIGIRMALGAEGRRVVWTVLREVFLVVAIGIAIGVPTALVACRLASTQIAGLLFGLEATDPSTIGAAVLLLALSAAIAGLLPALRAARIDPLRALRPE